MANKRAYCPKCKGMKEILNPKVEKTQRGIALKGNCLDCNTRLATFISKDEAKLFQKPQNLPEGVIVHKTSQITRNNAITGENLPQPIENHINLPPDKTIREINTQIANLQVQKAEKERVLRYMEEVKKNPVLNSHGISIFDNNEQKVVKRSIYTLLKILLVLFGVAIIVLFFMGYKGYFKDNNNCNPTNVCQECPTIPNCPTFPACPECNVNCPNVNCSQICNFPSNLTINLINSS